MLHERQRSAREACGPAGGMHARDQRAGNWQMGLKRTDRLTTTTNLAAMVRVKEPISLSTGNGRDIRPDRNPQSKSARKRANAERADRAREARKAR